MGLDRQHLRGGNEARIRSSLWLQQGETMGTEWRMAPLAVAFLLARLPTAAATVRTDTGLVQGVRVNTLSVYKGIPFAAPPVGELRWREPQWAWARLEATKGRHSVYYYHFTYKPPFPEGSVRAGWGASHYAELWYMFDHLDQETWRWSAADRKLADTMSRYWVNFVRGGDPNERGLPHWPEFTPTGDRVLYLDDSIQTKGVANLKTLRVFDAVYSQVRDAPFGVLPQH